MKKEMLSNPSPPCPLTSVPARTTPVMDEYKEKGTGHYFKQEVGDGIIKKRG